MEYIVRFNRDLVDKKIPMRNKYVDQAREKSNDDIDVITDLMEYNRSTSSACLPIAKQIVTIDKKICLQLPKIGDLFIGILHHKVIEKVTFIISNYLEEFIIEGQLCKINDLLIWKFTDLPVLLLTINDYENVNINVQINTNNEYNIQSGNQDVFKGCYGYFNQAIRQELMTHVIYHIPLLNKTDHLKIICGIWSICSVD